MVGERPVRELRSEHCLDLGTLAPTRKGCAVTRSFSNRVEDLSTMDEAIAAHAARLGEKLRGEGLGTDHVTDFFHTSEQAALVSKDAAPRPAQALGYIEPFVGGSYVAIGRDRFVESGGVAALTSLARDTAIGAATAGLRAQTSLDLGLGLPVSAHGLVGYRRAFGDVVPTALLAFGTGPSFLTAGIPIDRDALVAEAGLDLRVAPNATLGVAYTGQVGSRAEDHAVKGNFTVRF